MSDMPIGCEVVAEHEQGVVVEWYVTYYYRCYRHDRRLPNVSNELHEKPKPKPQQGPRGQ